MCSDSANAGLHCVIGTAAQSYVRQYEEPGVSGELADQAKAVLQNFNSRAFQALGCDAATRLAILGEVAVESQWKVSEFCGRATR
ncbi:MAG: hypothetical protein WAW46_14605 [Polaromonas sp.]